MRILSKRNNEEDKYSETNITELENSLCKKKKKRRIDIFTSSSHYSNTIYTYPHLHLNAYTK